MKRWLRKTGAFDKKSTGTPGSTLTGAALTPGGGGRGGLDDGDGDEDGGDVDLLVRHGDRSGSPTPAPGGKGGGGHRRTASLTLGRG